MEGKWSRALNFLTNFTNSNSRESTGMAVSEFHRKGGRPLKSRKRMEVYLHCIDSHDAPTGVLAPCCRWISLITERKWRWELQKTSYSSAVFTYSWSQPPSRNRISRHTHVQTAATTAATAFTTKISKTYFPPSPPTPKSITGFTISPPDRNPTKWTPSPFAGGTGRWRNAGAVSMTRLERL